MQYNIFKSIIASKKKQITLASDSDSFFVRHTPINPYIKPSFSKVDFPKERPSILLVSAIGASGKTTVAHAISLEVQLPILDLAKHKAVGDNTLTGILTTAYPLNIVGTVLEGLQHGEYGIIIDGIDEGRTKTTEQGFEAFLDDLLKRSKGSAAPAIIVFGRSQVILNTWIYLDDKGADVGLVELDPFSLKQAKEYIDSHVEGNNPTQKGTYVQARDLILAKLGAAFSADTPEERGEQNRFLSFIGYPPVLDAISTLLQTEKNYYSLCQSLGPATSGQLETKLLVDISEYLLRREHTDKALPNFIEEIANDAGPEKQEFLQSLYMAEEQCARVLSRALNQQFPRRLIDDDSLNERYEGAVGEWSNEHPFLEEGRVRNVVFAAFAVARCALSNIREYRDLAYSYFVEHQPTYHFLYIFDELVHDATVEVRYFNTLIQSVSESVGVNANVSAEITGSDWEEFGGDELQELDAGVELVITIEFPDRNQKRSFVFNGKIGIAESILMGPSLVNASVTVPCAVDLTASSAIESMGSCSISARRVNIKAPALTLHQISKRDTGEETYFLINAHIVKGHVDEVSTRAGLMKIRCVENNVNYLLSKYIMKAEVPTKDAMLSEKYRRLRRIFFEFASHSKGGLAKYRQKIEHERVLRGNIGWLLLNALVSEGVLKKDVRFYHVNVATFSNKLGISWHQLRKYETSDKLEKFLRNI